MSHQSDRPTTAIQVVPQLVELLSSLSAEEQKRAVAAAMILLGQSPSANASTSAALETRNEAGVPGISVKAAAWMRKYAIAEEQLDHVFSISPEEIDVIAASLPGDSKRQQTLEAYLLCGLRAFIQSGEARFDDKDARNLSQKLGCYDSANHSNYMKAFGNLLSGSKETGWRLTNPGFERAAQIVKQLADSPAA